MFEWLGKHPAEGKRFNSAISSLAPAGRSLSFLTQSFDWASLGKGTVVDVGGMQGAVSILLAEAFPDLHFVVQDLPEVIEGAREKVPAHVAQRIEFVPHSAFDDQPVVADAYVLRAVLSNWPDKYCVQILRRLVPALRHGARILISDSIVPDLGTQSHLMERNVRYVRFHVTQKDQTAGMSLLIFFLWCSAYDMLMMALFNAREREKKDWIQLLRDADPRFRFVEAKRQEIGTMGIILAEWEDVDRS